jgi:hypothetical protein
MRKPARLFSNADVTLQQARALQENDIPRHDGLTRSIFDFGVIWIDPKRIGILWLEEDY